MSCRALSAFSSFLLLLTPLVSCSFIERAEARPKATPIVSSQSWKLETKALLKQEFSFDPTDLESFQELASFSNSDRVNAVRPDLEFLWAPASDNSTATVAPATLDSLSSATVESFEVLGSTVFSEEELAAATAPFTNRPLSFTELFQARSAVTELYTSKGYVNSGAFIPPQEFQERVATIQVVEGELEAINITGTRRLDPDYIRSRLTSATAKPLNAERLLEALQVLRLNPLIENVSADLSAGPNPGQSILDVQVEEADSFAIKTTFDNARSPSVGSERRIVELNEGNLLGFGDQFELRYTNSDGSDAFDVAYSIPVNASNGTFRIAYGTASNEVIEEPFNPLDIKSGTEYYDLTFRQPVLQSPGEEFVLGLSASHFESETSLREIPFPLSRGADSEGRTKISALRFFQEWVKRGERDVFAARSQFSLGLNVLNATDNDDGPDSDFFAWRGQGQWVKLLAEDTLMLVRADLQLSDQGLVPLEQLRLGGINSIRGYRQDLLLGDNGFLACAELRLPILRISQWDGVLQITPFVDFGTAWNSGDFELDPNTLASVGLGLRWQHGDRFAARIDWGLPLINDRFEGGGSLQEDGIYFSVEYTPF